MQKEPLEFLTKLLNTPSPSGFEERIQKVIKRRVSKYADDVRLDVHGNLDAVLNPGGKVRVMLAGHCDQIGLMVTHISDKGFLSIDQIGGIDPTVLPGTEVLVLTEGGDIPGVIGLRPVHLTPPEQRGQKVELAKVWIDIGAGGADEAKKLVNIGDPVVFKPGMTRLGKHRITGAGLDDRVGAFVVMEVLRLVKKGMKGKKNFPVELHAVSTVQEELGLRGARTAAYGIDPHVGIAVDVTHAADNPGADAKRVGDCDLGSGPVLCRGANINPVIGTMLIETARAKKIKFQLGAAPRALGNDANSMQLTRAGVATATIGIPNRYMHTPIEVCDLRDLEFCAKVIAETVLKITSRTSFIPS